MTIKHHVGNDLLLSYGAGTLDEATSLLVATHLALCPACRADLELIEAVGGALIEQTPEDVTADEAMLESIVSSPHPQDEGSAPDRAVSSKPFVLPQPLRDYAGGGVDELEWRSVGGGIRQVPLNTGSARVTARLLSIPARKSVPDHGHRSVETTLVLAGSFYDRGSWYRRGDVGIAGPEVVHHPVAGPEQDCICLAVTDARLKFQAPIPRLLQPFHGI